MAQFTFLPSFLLQQAQGKCMAVHYLVRTGVMTAAIPRKWRGSSSHRQTLPPGRPRARTICTASAIEESRTNLFWAVARPQSHSMGCQERWVWFSVLGGCGLYWVGMVLQQIFATKKCTCAYLYINFEWKMHASLCLVAKMLSVS